MKRDTGHQNENYTRMRVGSPTVGIFGLIMIWGMVLLLTGCPKPPLPSPVPPGTEIAEMTTEEVARLVQQRVEQFQSLRGIGKIRIQSWDEQYKFAEAFVLESPERFRLETLGFLDQPVIFLTSDEQTLSLYSKKHNKYYRGLASQENLFKLSGINLSVENVILVLSGNPPFLAPVNSVWGTYLPGLQSYYLERISFPGNIVQRIWFNTTLQLISNVQEYRLTDGELVLDIQFEDYRAEAGNYPIPARILIDRPLDKTRVEILYQFFDVNQQPDPSVFTFIPPEDAEIYYLDDMTAPQLEHLAPYEEFRVQENSP